MTPWEWSLAVLTVGPVVSCIAAVLLVRQQGERGSAAFLALAGLAGVSACVYGVVAEAPFTLQTSVFFSMVAAFDKFSAIVLLPFVLMVFIAGLTRMRPSTSNNVSSSGSLRAILFALLVMSVTWSVMVTNIVALAMSLMLMLGAMVALAAVDRVPRGTISRWFFVHSAGALAIIAGWFVLSSGALFNDFSTISYIAAQLDEARLAIAFALVLFGASLLANAWACVKAKESFIGMLATPELRATVRVALVVVPVYILLRMLLFVLPPLTAWYAIPVGAIGAIALMCGTMRLKVKTLQSTSSTHLAGLILLALATAVYFQATGAFDAMNAALFSALVMTIGGSLAVAAGEWALEEGRFGAGFALIQRVSVLGLPPSLLFMGQWLLLTTLLSALGSEHRLVAAVMVGTVLLLVKVMWRRAGVAVKETRAMTMTRDGEVMWSPALLLGVSTVGAFFVPWALNQIGAAPLTLAPTAWNAAIVSGDGALRLVIICGLSFGFAGVAWMFRNRAVQDTIVIHGESPSALAETRFTAFRRDIARLARQYLVMPVRAKATVAYQWYESHSHRVVSPAFLFVIVVILLTLVLAV